MNTRKRALTYPPAPLPSPRRRLEPSPGEWRDWASLPRDVLCIVLGRLRQPDILRGAGLACSHWRRVALEEPLLWRDVDLSDPVCCRGRPPRGWKAMARVSVDRSAGQCRSFMGHVDAGGLAHLANRAPLLRSLEIASWPCGVPFATDILVKLPLLERFVLWGGSFPDELLRAILDCCPRLKLLDATDCLPVDWEPPIKRRVWNSRIKQIRMPPNFHQYHL